MVDRRDVFSATSGTKVFDHPVAGELTLDWEILDSAAEPDQRVVVMTAEPGSASHDVLLSLASEPVGSAR